MATFAEFFRSSEPGRDAFLSRLFGLFSEDIVRAWCGLPASRYEDLGRPTLRGNGIPNFFTLDFTLRDRDTGRVYVSEMKCELQYNNYRQLTLANESQILSHAKGKAFHHFLELARQPDLYQVAIGRKIMPIDGAILVWGDTASQALEMVRERFGIHDALSVSDMIETLAHERPAAWHERVATLNRWSTDLFAFLDREARR